MKLILILLSILITSNLYAVDGTVISLEAPLFFKPNNQSRVLQTIRKGEVIYIRKSDIETSSFTPSYVDTEVSVNASADFYRTLTKNGQDAFIAKKHIKVLFKDTREYKKMLHKQSDDLTDYRLLEPLTKNYPFSPKEDNRATIGVLLGASEKINYPYTQDFLEENYSNRIGFTFMATRKVQLDNYNRIQFGGMLNYSFQKNSFTLFKDNQEASESHNEINIGPVLSFDILTSKKYRFSFLIGPSISFHSFSVTQEDLTTSEDETRGFTAFSLTSHPTSIFQIIDIFNGPKIDFSIGVNLKANFSHSLRSSSLAENESIWQDTQSDLISFPTALNYSMQFGLQTYY